MTREEYINILEIEKAELTKENQELKKQLEETDRKLFFTKNELDMREKTIDNKLNQQKEFIKYLEDEMNKCQSNIFADGVKYGFQLSLSKYKKIIGVLDENNIK